MACVPLGCLHSDLVVTNASSGLPGASQTITYEANLVDPTTTNSSMGTKRRMVQTFSFFSNSSVGQFDGLSFSIGSGTLKWSIFLNTSLHSSSASSSSSSSETVLRYALDSLLTIANVTTEMAPTITSSSASINITSGPSATVTNATTYVLPLFTFTSPSSSSSNKQTATAQVDVFDVALIDGSLVPINHSIVVVPPPPTNASSSQTSSVAEQYVLELRFPGFNESVEYDPSIGLGVIVGGDGSSSSSAGSDNVALIVATAVVIPVAVAVVVVVIGSAVAFAWWRRRASHEGVVNFNVDRENDQEEVSL